MLVPGSLAMTLFVFIQIYRWLTTEGEAEERPNVPAILRGPPPPEPDGNGNGNGKAAAGRSRSKVEA